MRRFAALAILVWLLVGCHGGGVSDSLASKAQDDVAKIETATDPTEIANLSQDLYSCGPYALDAISVALNQYDYKAKPQLVAIASAIPDERSTWIVDKQMHSKVHAARTVACYGLAMRQTAPMIHAMYMLRINDEQEREWATYTIAKSIYERRASLLPQQLKDSDPYVRAEAARGFRTLPGPTSIALVKPFLKDKDNLVASEAFLTIAKLDPSDATVQDEAKQIGERALKADLNDKASLALLLGASGLPQAEPYLSKLLGDGDPRVRAVAARAYGGLGKAASVDRIKRSLLTDPDVHVRAEAGASIAKLKVTGIGMTLLKLVMGRDQRVSQIGMDTMVDLNLPDCMGPLMYVIQNSPTMHARREAAIGLTNMAIGRDPWPEIGEIFDMSRSANKQDRVEAAQLLGRLHGPRYFCRLQDMISDSDADVRVAAMENFKRQLHMPTAMPRVIDHPMPSWIEDQD